MNYKLESSLSHHIESLKEANAKISDAYDILANVKSMIDNGEWSGKSQQISRALCEICDRYHMRILENVNKENEVLKNLYDKADGYMSGGKIPSEWR